MGGDGGVHQAGCLVRARACGIGGTFGVMRDPVLERSATSYPLLLKRSDHTMHAWHGEVFMP